MGERYFFAAVCERYLFFVLNFGFTSSKQFFWQEARKQFLTQSGSVPSWATLHHDSLHAMCGWFKVWGIIKLVNKLIFISTDWADDGESTTLTYSNWIAVTCIPLWNTAVRLHHFFWKSGGNSQLLNIFQFLPTTRSLRLRLKFWGSKVTSLSA